MKTASNILQFDIIDLKDCPFCGGKAIIVRHPGTNWDGKEPKHINVGAMHGLWYVGCPHAFFEGLTPHCEIHPSASWYAHLEDAINAWNDRIGDLLKQGRKPKGRV